MRVDFNEEDSSISGAIQLDFSCIKPTRDIFTSSLVSYKDYFYKEIYSREGRDRQHWKIQDLVSFWMLLYASPCQPKSKQQYIHHRKATQGQDTPLPHKRPFMFPLSEANHQLKPLQRKESILGHSLPLLLSELIEHWQFALIMFQGFTKNDTSDHSNSASPLKLSTAEESPQLGTPTSKPALCSPQHTCVAPISINGSCGSPLLREYLQVCLLDEHAIKPYGPNILRKAQKKQKILIQTQGCSGHEKVRYLICLNMK